jgi:hypothetical protein
MTSILGRTGHLSRDMTATHATVKHLYMDNFLSSLYLFDDLTKQKIKHFTGPWAYKG